MSLLRWAAEIISDHGRWPGGMALSISAIRYRFIAIAGRLPVVSTRYAEPSVSHSGDMPR